VGKIADEIESTAVKADAWHHISDAMTSAFAFFGITVALLTRNPAADDWAALCAAPIIIFDGIRQLRPPILELLDTAPPKNLEQELRRVAHAVHGVAGLEKCLIRKMGFKYYVDLHVEVDGRISVTSGHRIAHEVEAEILAALPSIAKVIIHVEPSPETRC
jgi:cation diffusion facilitator family transporter